MSKSLLKIINVRVTAPIAAAVKHRAEIEGITVSEFGRDCLETAVSRATANAAKLQTPRERAEILAALSKVNDNLARLGNLYAYGLKAHRPVGAEEDRERRAALTAVRDAARRLLDP